MFAEFLNIIFKSIRLDKTLYSDNRNFGEAAIYFAGFIMILDGTTGVGEIYKPEEEELVTMDEEESSGI